MARASDAGPVAWPKLFRARVLWRAARSSRRFRGAFEAYLADAARLACSTEEYLAQGAAAATLHPLGAFVRAGALRVLPEEIVLREAPSELRDAHGARVGAWW